MFQFLPFFRIIFEFRRRPGGFELAITFRLSA